MNGAAFAAFAAFAAVSLVCLGAALLIVILDSIASVLSARRERARGRRVAAFDDEESRLRAVLYRYEPWGSAPPAR